MLEKLKEISKQRNLKLNKIEKLKPNRTVDEAMEVLKKYAVSGYDSIDKDDATLFFKYFGIFDKVKPNGKNSFMLRIRIPGGQLTPTQAKKIGNIAKTYGGDYIDITTRMQIQLRFLLIEDLPTILEELDSVGITTYQTGIDNLRNIVTDPLDGLSYDNVIESMPLIEQLQEIFLKKSEWIGTLPRKFNTSITGSYANRCNVFAHDCCFVLAQKDGIFGFNLYLGGRVGILAKDANVFLEEGEVVEFFTALIEIFKEYGFRDNRNKNRLHFFIEEVGMENLVTLLKYRCDKEFKSAGQQMVELEHFDAKYGKIKQKDGLFALHVVVPAGIFTGKALIEASEIADKEDGSIRLSVDQNLYIVGVKESNIEKILSHKLFSSYKNINTPFYNDMISCSGSDTCSFGVIRGKMDALKMSKYLSQMVELDDGKVRIYWSACVKGCGIHDLGDIGLLGCKTKIGDKTVPGVDISLGGKLINESLEAKLLLKSIPIVYARYYIEELILEYKRLKKSNESFEKFFDRVLVNYSYGAIAFMMSFNYMISRKFDLPNNKIKLEEESKTFSNESLEIEYFGRVLRERLNPQIASLVDKMSSDIGSFSELLEDINQF